MSVSMEKITEVTGSGLSISGNDIDTDRIIPARFLKEITFSNMGKYAFRDERFDEHGGKKDHPYNDEKFAGFNILVVNRNFGCGSSREHAPQALMRSGVKALIGESFAEIFAGNCTMLGIPVITASQDDAEALQAWVVAHPREAFTIDLVKKTVAYGERVITVNLPDTSRKALVEGTWDSTRLLLANEDATRKIAQGLPYVTGFAAA